MTATPTARRTRLARALAFALVAVALTVAFARGREPRGPTARLDADAHYYYLPLPSLVVDGDLDFANQYAEHGNWYGFGPTPIGRPGNVFGVGPAVFSAPFFLVGRAVALATGDRTDGFSRPEIVCTLFASVVATLGAWLATARLIRRRLGDAAAPMASALATMLAGPVVYYAVRQPGYAHPFGALFTALLVDAWDRSYDGAAPRSLRTWGALGLLFGAVSLARPQLATWGILLLAALIDDVRRAATTVALRRVALGALAAAAGALAAFSPQLLAWRAIYGSALTVPQGPGFLRWSEPALTEVLFSARNGLFAWAPLYALGALGLVASLRSRVGATLLAAVLLQALVNGAAWDWWGGGAFGGRRFCSCYVAFAFGAAALYDRARRWLGPRAGLLAPQLAAAIGALAALGNVALAMTYATSTARIEGGARPSDVMRERLGPKVGALYGGLSDLAMAPARALFALRHDAPYGAYDAIVGVHQLDELWPGLNARVAPRVSETRLDGGRLPPFAIGFAPGERGASMRGARAELLIALNERRTSLTLTLELDAPATVAWNGARVAMAGAPPTLTATIVDLRRGVNVLRIEAPPGTRVRRVRLEAIGE